ncbi:MAG: hypothetical protein LBQ91_04985 [Oscillospiraceae bacterium]|jgi:hypothetical protein|nr:hypothetical protein [Oscillospiraceae bacterium]
MDFNFAKQQAKRIFKRKLVLFLVVAVIWGVVFFFVGGPSRLSNIFGSGEQFTTAGDLETLYNKNIKRIKTTADDFVQYWYITEDNKVTVRYFYYDAGDQFILVRMPARYSADDYANFEVSGTVRKRNSGEAEMFSEFISDVAESFEVSELTAQKYVSSYVIAYGTANIGVLFVIASAVLLVFLIIQLFALISLVNEKRSKSFKRLALAGNPDPDVVNYNISREIQDYATVTFKNAYFTRSYLIFLRAYGYDVRRGEDLVWIYKRVTQNSYNGIPTGKTFQLICCFADGKTLSLPTGKKTSDEVLTTAAEMYPNAIFGYSQELSRLWKPKNLAPFLAARDEIIAKRNAPVYDMPPDAQE